MPILSMTPKLKEIYNIKEELEKIGIWVEGYLDAPLADEYLANSSNRFTKTEKSKRSEFLITRVKAMLAELENELENRCKAWQEEGDVNEAGISSAFSGFSNLM